MKSLREVIAIVDEVSFRDWKFLVETDQLPAVGVAPGYLVLEFHAPCSVTGEQKVQRSRKWPLSPHMTRGEIVQTAWLAVQTALEHEAREDFQWRGAAVFGPHFDIERLRELCVLNAMEVRA